MTRSFRQERERITSPNVRTATCSTKSTDKGDLQGVHWPQTGLLGGLFGEERRRRFCMPSAVLEGVACSFWLAM